MIEKCLFLGGIDGDRAIAIAQGALQIVIAGGREWLPVRSQVHLWYFTSNLEVKGAESDISCLCCSSSSVSRSHDDRRRRRRPFMIEKCHFLSSNVGNRAIAIARGALQKLKDPSERRARGKRGGSEPCSFQRISNLKFNLLHVTQTIMIPFFALYCGDVS